MRKAVSWAMLGLGVASLFASIVYTSSILAFIGLGLLFWGAILIYVSPQEYAKRSLIGSSFLPSLETLNRIIQELDYKGKPIYLPPKYLRDPEANRVYISKQKDAKLPTPEPTLEQEDRLFIGNPHGILFTPVGAELARLMEETIGTSFTKVDLGYLTRKLPKLFIEDLEIAENLEMKTERDKICVETTNSVYRDTCKQAAELSNMHGTIGCPQCSAIACALTKATGKPVIIENTQFSEDGKTVETTYRILGPAESEEQILEGAKVSLATARYIRLSKLAGISLIGLGSIILSFVGWITYHDMTTWGKSLASIFLGPRTGEAMSLAIGMRVLYYFVLGLTSTLIGIFILFRRRRNQKTQPTSHAEPAEE